MANGSFKYMVLAIDVETAEVKVLGSDTMPSGTAIEQAGESPHGGKLVLPEDGPVALVHTNPCTWFFDGHSWYRICKP